MVPYALAPPSHRSPQPAGPLLVVCVADSPEQCIGAGGYRHACGEASTGLTAQRRADVRLGPPEPVGGPSPRCGEPREAPL